jgi:hypothetical protein
MGLMVPPLWLSNQFFTFPRQQKEGKYELFDENDLLL